MNWTLSPLVQGPTDPGGETTGGGPLEMMADGGPRLMRRLAEMTLRAKVGRQAAAVVVERAADAYVRPPSGRTSTGRLNLEMGAYLLALRDGLTASGYGEVDANGLLADSLFNVMHRFYRPLDALAFLLHPRNRLARTRFRQRFSRRFLFAPPD